AGGGGAPGATRTRTPRAPEDPLRPGQESLRPGEPLPANGPAGPGGAGLPQEHGPPGRPSGRRTQERRILDPPGPLPPERGGGVQRPGAHRGGGGGRPEGSGPQSTTG